MLGIVIVCLTIVLIILSILFFPTIHIGRHKISTYWIIPVISAIILLICKCVSWDNVISAFTANTSVNPLKILVLFISMTILSIFLDEIGFFNYIAIKSTKLFKNSQLKLFFGFYFLIAILTVFTSNDIIILTFTPFICYYAKSTKINPIPYLISEFVAANTWSMALIIGNPTNIYLASAFEIDFLTYFKMMILPTIGSALFSLLILFLLFRKSLKQELEPFIKDYPQPNKFLLIVGLLHLFVTTILLAISSYIGLEMWYITLGFATSLIIIVLIYLLVTHKRLHVLTVTLLRAPYNLIPFILSMFILVLTLNEQGVTQYISEFLNNLETTYAYGISGAITANLINNIPMSVLYSNILTNTNIKAIYASIIASNIAAFITPIGALAGIMWMNLLKTFEVEFSFKKFVFYGITIGIPTLLVALTILFVL